MHIFNLVRNHFRGHFFVEVAGVVDDLFLPYSVEIFTLPNIRKGHENLQQIRQKRVREREAVEIFKYGQHLEKHPK